MTQLLAPERLTGHNTKSRDSEVVIFCWDPIEHLPQPSQRNDSAPNLALCDRESTRSANTAIDKLSAVYGKVRASTSR